MRSAIHPTRCHRASAMGTSGGSPRVTVYDDHGSRSHESTLAANIARPRTGRGRRSGGADSVPLAASGTYGISPYPAHPSRPAHGQSVVATGRTSVPLDDSRELVALADRSAKKDGPRLGGVMATAQPGSCSMSSNDLSDDEPRRLPAGLRLVG